MFEMGYCYTAAEVLGGICCFEFYRADYLTTLVISSLPIVVALSDAPDS